jgi:tRNA-specific 2-thiouridylase
MAHTRPSFEEWLTLPIDHIPFEKRELAQTKVLIGLSGGPSSLVAALLLKKRGVDCVGLTIQTFQKKKIQDLISERRKEIIEADSTRAGNQRGLGRVGPSLEEDISITDHSCQLDTIEDIQEICRHWRIPHYVYDGEQEFSEKILDPLVVAKLQGKFFPTCLYCHKTKIEILLRKAYELNIDFVATGHYIKVHRHSDTGDCDLVSSADEQSDQSYLLSRVPSALLQRLVFPLSELRHVEVMKLADQFQLKGMRQQQQRAQFCLTNKGNVALWVEKKAHEKLWKKGIVSEEITGIQHGDHWGIHYFTLGEKQFSQKLTCNLVTSHTRDFVVTKIQPSGKIFVGPEQLLQIEGVGVHDLILGQQVPRNGMITLYLQSSLLKERKKAFLLVKNNDHGLIYFQEKCGPWIEGQVLAFFLKNKGGKCLGSAVIDYTGDLGILDRLNKVKKKDKDEDSGNEDKKGPDSDLEKNREQKTFRF